MDFTLRTYKALIAALRNQGFSFLTFDESFSAQQPMVTILRHDVDSLPQNSLEFARLQGIERIKGTYYFRFVPQSYKESIIKEIHDLGHEIGYHYETMGTCKGDINKAFDLFCKNLEIMRKLVPVKTICMHGSPLSKYDNRLIWEKYDYRKLGLKGEPYFDVDFNKVLYLTDTGRRWDGDSCNVRDKAQSITSTKASVINAGHGAHEKSKRLLTTEHRLPFPKFHSTFDIIKAAENNQLPDKIMMTFHPQRWTDRPLPWLRELVLQNTKNVAKYFLIQAKEMD